MNPSPLGYDEPTLMIPNISEHDENCDGSVSLSSTIQGYSTWLRTAEKLPPPMFCAMKLKAAGFVFSDIEKGTAKKLPGLHGFRTAAGLLMENG
jgi:hypothetical protein